MRMTGYRYTKLKQLIKLLDKLGVPLRLENLSIAIYAKEIVIVRRGNEHANNIPSYRCKSLDDVVRPR